MDKNTRRNKLIALVNRERTISFSELKHAFPDVSEMTLRTDLKHLDEQRLIVRVRGGARSVGYVIGTDDFLERRNARRVEEKTIIAQKAAGLLRPNTSIFLDSGSTITMMVRYIKIDNLLVFTNSLVSAQELSHLEQIQTHMVGGRLNRYSMSVYGGQAAENISKISFDQLFLGATGYQQEQGLSCGSDEEAALKRSCISRADQVILLMDSGKIDHRSTFRICGLEKIDLVVTDGKAPESFLRECSEHNVEVM